MRNELSKEVLRRASLPDKCRRIENILNSVNKKNNEHKEKKESK